MIFFLTLRTALSSRVRSNHCDACVCAAIAGSPIRYRASEHVRSERIGLRLYAIALDPIWPKQKTVADETEHKKYGKREQKSKKDGA